MSNAQIKLYKIIYEYTDKNQWKNANYITNLVHMFVIIELSWKGPLKVTQSSSDANEQGCIKLF